MDTQVKKIDSIRRELNVTVTGDTVKNKFEEVFKKLEKEAKLPGFRPGHVPRDLLEKNFASSAHDQVLKELIPDAYNEAIKKEGLDAIEFPEITDVKLDRANLSFKAVVEVSPEIALKDYRGAKIKFKKVEVSTDEIKRNIDSLKEARKVDNPDDKFARSLGYPNLAELEKAVERQIFSQKEHKDRQRIENEIIENLTGGLDFKLPPSLVNRQLQELLKHAKVDLAMKGFPREKIEEQEKELIKALEPEAKKQVKVYLVLSEIAKKEGIPLDDHMPEHVMEFLLREADWQEAN